MIIINKNEGKKIDYSVSGTKLIINEELILDLSKYERDFPVHLDICKNEYDMLCMGMGRSYIMEIDIPEKSYTSVTTDTTVDGEPIKEEIKTPVLFNIDLVTLTLWEVI